MLSKKEKMGKKKKKTIHVAPMKVTTTNVDPLIDCINCTNAALNLSGDSSLELDNLKRPQTAGSGLKQASVNEFTQPSDNYFEEATIVEAEETKEEEMNKEEKRDEQKKEEQKKEEAQGVLQKLFKLFGWSK